MNVLRKYGGFVSCFLMSLISAVALEAGSVVRLGETVPRAILFGLGLFALWLAIWLLGLRVVVVKRLLPERYSGQLGSAIPRPVQRLVGRQPTEASESWHQYANPLQWRTTLDT